MSLIKEWEEAVDLSSEDNTLCKRIYFFFFCLINLQIQDIPHTVCISISLSLLTSVLLQLDYMNSATHSITEMYPTFRTRMRILPNACHF